MELTKEEFITESDKISDLFHRIREEKDAQKYIIYQLWSLLWLEDKLKLVSEKYNLMLKRERFHDTPSLYGIIQICNKVVGVYKNEPFPTIELYNFTKNRSKIIQELIDTTNPVKLIKGVHRVLDWHSVIYDGYVHKLADRTYILNYVPVCPTDDDLQKLHTDVTNYEHLKT